MAVLDQFGKPLNSGRYVPTPSRDAGSYRGSIANWRPLRVVNVDGEVRERLTTQRRAADLAANDWSAKSGLRAIADNAIGTGLVPKSAIPHKILGISKEDAAQLGEKLEWAFSVWSAQAHARGQLHFEDLQYLGISSILRLGEMLHLPVMLPLSGIGGRRDFSHPGYAARAALHASGQTAGSLDQGRHRVYGFRQARGLLDSLSASVHCYC